MNDVIEFYLSGKRIIIDNSRTKLDIKVSFYLNYTKDLNILKELAEYSKIINVSSLSGLIKAALAEWVKLRNEGCSDQITVKDIEKLLATIL